MKRRNFLKYHNAKLDKGYRFENPYFAEKNKNGSFKLYIFVPVIIFFLVLIIWGIIAIPWMHISTIEINGLITTQPNSVITSINNKLAEPIFKFLPGNHIWLFSEDKIIKQIENEFQLSNTSMHRDGRKLIINVDEKITRAVWISNNQMSFLDKDGLIVKQLTPDEQAEAEMQINTQTNPNIFLQSFIVPIWDLSNTLLQSENNIVISNATLDTVLKFDELLRKSNSIPISYQIEEPNQIWLIAKTTLEIDIYFDGVGDAQEQFDNLQLILSEYKNDIQNLEYIDLRFDNRVYIK